MTITITGREADEAATQANERNKQVIFKIFPPFIDYDSEISHTHVDNAKDLDVVMRTYN